MNSKNKGKIGEREFAKVLAAAGYPARRGQQFSGSPESPDVVCEALPFHIEVKRVERLNLSDATAQAERDAKGRPWIVAHRRNRSPWLITMRAETFFRLLRGELSPGASRTGYEGTKGTNGTDATPHPGPLPVRGGEGGKIWDAQQHVPTTENKNQKQKEQST